MRLLSWQAFKSIVVSTSTKIHFGEDDYTYYIFNIFFQVACEINKNNKNAELEDFENNFKPTANQAPAFEAVTQFEKNDKDLKIASGVASAGQDGIATLSIESGDLGRYIDEGMAWFWPKHPDDWIASIVGTDEYGIYTGVSGTVVKTYHDDDLPEDLQGWRVPYQRGHIELDTMAGYGFVPPGIRLKVTGKSGFGADAAASGVKLYTNIKWGKLG